MHIKHLKDCPEFTGGDKSKLREILNPRKEPLKINYSLARAILIPEGKTLPHKLDSTEVYYIIKGKGRVHINNQEKVVKPSDTIYIPPEAIQYIENTGNEDLEFLCIVEPKWQSEIEHILKYE